MRIVLDIDGTIGTVADGDYPKTKPHIKMVDLINDMYDAGHTIILYTARGMGTNNSVVAKAYNQWYSFTEKQLEGWGVKYHELHLGKPMADVYVDDRAFRVREDGGSADNLKEFLEHFND